MPSLLISSSPQSCLCYFRYVCHLSQSAITRCLSRKVTFSVSVYNQHRIRQSFHTKHKKSQCIHIRGRQQSFIFSTYTHKELHLTSFWSKCLIFRELSDFSDKEKISKAPFALRCLLGIMFILLKYFADSYLKGTLFLEWEDTELSTVCYSDGGSWGR